MSTPASPARVVVLVSGSGTLLQALLDACDDPGYGVEVVAVGADRRGTLGEQRAVDRGIPTFVCRVADHVDRSAWDEALRERLLAYAPDLVVSAGFMKVLGPRVLDEVTVVNTHPALLPSFPGAHGVADALAYGVKVTGTTCHVVDGGVDTGPIIDQRSVPVLAADTVESLHERIKVEERTMLVKVVGRIAREGFIVRGRRFAYGIGR